MLNQDKGCCSRIVRGSIPITLQYENENDRTRRLRAFETCAQDRKSAWRLSSLCLCLLKNASGGFLLTYGLPIQSITPFTSVWGNPIWMGADGWKGGGGSCDRSSIGQQD